MRFFTTLVAFVALSVSALAAAPPVPRPAKEFDFVEPSGKHVLLSSLKGKVVIVQGLLVTCPHCQAYSQLLTKMQTEYGSRGFQAMGIAYDVDAGRAQSYVTQFQVGFPVGYAPEETMLSFLGFATERFTVPQVVIIDRKGVIQAQSPAMSDGVLQQEANVRVWIEKLLGPAPALSGKGSPGAKGGPASSNKPADIAKKPVS